MEMYHQPHITASSPEVPPNISADSQNVSLSSLMLGTPLDSVNDIKPSAGTLQDSALKLHNEDQTLQELKSTKTDIVIRRDRPGAKFPQFTKLPAELRRMIWRFACTAPQIHVIACGEKGSRANVNKVMNACTEAKSVGLALQLDYFCFHTYYDHTDPRYPGLVKYFVNADVDTFWILPIAEKVSFPDDIDWYCGKCDQLFYIKDPRPCSRCESFSRFNMPQGIHSLALDFMIWHEPDIYDLPKGTMELCMRYDVKELLLVVGYYAPVPSERDPALVAPCQSPPLTWLHLSQELDLPPTRDLQILESAKPIWQDLEESLARQIEEIREQRAKDRQAAIDSGEASSFE